MQKATELSEKAKARLRLNEEAREHAEKKVRLDIGQKKAYVFYLEKVLEADPDNTRDDGSQYTVIPYIVEDERYPGVEKIFNASPQLSQRIDGLLAEAGGRRRLMIEKERSGQTGRYNVYPA